MCPVGSAADVWVNGHEVATSATVTGAYTRFTFDITGLVTSGTNALAIEVYPNDPTTMFTLDNVDWTQIPPDNNTGIQFPVQLPSRSTACRSSSAAAGSTRTSSCTIRRPTRPSRSR